MLVLSKLLDADLSHDTDLLSYFIASPAASLGIQEGDAHIIRNAGGSAKDALRSIIISQRLLGTREVAVFHHTGAFTRLMFSLSELLTISLDCGMLTFDNDHLRGLIKKADPSPEVAKEVDSIDFLTFPKLEESVKDDVKFLEDNKLILNEAKISGWVYEVETGKVKQVA